MTEQTQIEAFAEPVPEAVERRAAEPADPRPPPRPRGRPAGQRRLRGARAGAAAQAQRRPLAAALGRRRDRQRRGGLLGGGRGAATRSAAPAPRSSSPASSRSASAGGRRSRSAALRAAEPHEYETDGPGDRVRRLAGAAGGRTARTAGDGPEPAAARAARPLLRPRARRPGGASRVAPAAKTYHQAYRHGLLEHTLSVAQAVSAAANFFPGIDREVAVTGALLHDIGKCVAYNDDPLAIDLTDAGRLQGEIPLGYYTVRRAIEDLPGFDPHLAQCVLHIILSHHGSLEHGSPVVPATREAVLVHMIDNLGGRLGSFDRLETPAPRRRVLVGLRPGALRLRLLRPARRLKSRRFTKILRFGDFCASCCRRRVTLGSWR